MHYVQNMSPYYVLLEIFTHKNITTETVDSYSIADIDAILI